MRFSVGDTVLEAAVDRVVVAGWTGRDRAAVRHHIDELAALGVAPPSAVPLFYRVSAGLLVQSPRIQVLGSATSGEVEPFLLNADGTPFLGLASDHTGRDLETVSVAASKQACPKPVADRLWPLADLRDHMDRLVLHCEIAEGGAWVTYQQGLLAAILPLEDLAARAGLRPGTAMLCGTLGAIGGVRPAAEYRMALIDPVRDRRIDMAYGADPLEIVS